MVCFRRWAGFLTNVRQPGGKTRFCRGRSMRRPAGLSNWLFFKNAECNRRRGTLKADARFKEVQKPRSGVGIQPRVNEAEPWVSAPIWTSPERAKELLSSGAANLWIVFPVYQSRIFTLRSLSSYSSSWTLSRDRTSAWRRAFHSYLRLVPSSGLVHIGALLRGYQSGVCFPMRSFDLYLGRRINTGPMALRLIWTAQRHAVPATHSGPRMPRENFR
jgi:hypothetical protein